MSEYPTRYREPTPKPRRTPGQVLLAGSVQIAVAASWVFVIVVRPEPTGLFAIFMTLVFMVVALTALWAPILTLVRTRRWRGPSALAVAALAVTCSLAFFEYESESLHWRMSRGDFNALANGSRSCVDGCDAGNWTIDHMVISGRSAVLWLGYDEWCYMGLGYVRSTGSLLSEDELRDEVARSARSDYISLTPWHDDWYEVCVTS